MATPHVSGVAALILSCNANLTAAQVADILRQTAQPLRDNPGDPVPNNNYGSGCVDAEAAVNRACPQRPSQPIFSCPSVVVRCQSVSATQCPSVPFIQCQSRVVACASAVLRCPSTTVLCNSQVIGCPSLGIACPSVVVRCPSNLACPSATVACPSQLACPSGPVCGGLPGLPDPGELGWQGNPQSGQMSAEWEMYDPYSVWYGQDI
jgi:hypothetical protein